MEYYTYWFTEMTYIVNELKCNGPLQLIIHVINTHGLIHILFSLVCNIDEVENKCENDQFMELD